METGFIGLGAMGKYMAINLSKAGYLKTVFNRTTKKTEIFKKEYKCLVSNSPSELATRCRLIIISVSRDQDVLDIVKQLITKISSNSIIVDTSTTSSKTAKKATDLLKKVNQQLLQLHNQFQLLILCSRLPKAFVGVSLLQNPISTLHSY